MKMTLKNAVLSNAVVTMLAPVNPYREGTKAWTRFEAYTEGAKVEALLANPSVDREGLRWDLNTLLIDIVEGVEAGSVESQITRSKSKAVRDMTKPAAKKTSKKAEKVGNMTALEAKVIKGILDSEYDEGTVGKNPWTFSVIDNANFAKASQAAGAIASCVKKGFITSYVGKDSPRKGHANDDPSHVTLTQAGYDAYLAFTK